MRTYNFGIILIFIIGFLSSCSQKSTLRRAKYKYEIEVQNNRLKRLKETGIAVTDTSLANKGGNSAITITELAPNGDSILLDGTIKVVDPNSTLAFKINSQSIINSIAVKENTELTRKLKFYKELLELEKSVEDSIPAAIKKYNEGKKWSLTYLNPLVTAVHEDRELKDIYYKYAEDSDNSILSSYVILFKSLREYSKVLENDFREEAEKNGVYIQFGAFIEDKQGIRTVHIPGFDSYLPEKPYTVERMMLVLNDTQQEYMKEITAISSSANQTDFGSAVKAEFLPGIKDLFSTSITSLVSTNTQLEKALASGAGELKRAKAEVEQAQKLVSNYLLMIGGLKSKYSKEQTLTDQNLLLQVNNEISGVVADTKLLRDTLQKKALNIEDIRSSLNDLGKNALAGISDSLTSLGNDLTKMFDKFSNGLKQNVEVMRGGKRFREEAYALSEKVHKLSVGSIPEVGALALETTGKRDVGDVLTLKMLWGRPNEQVNEIVNMRYHLYFCSPYIKTSVSFLFTDPAPYFKRIDDKALFHYAPSYSLLLKGFWKNKMNSRKSLSYHNFYSPGLGLNIATLDFDGNGAMEVGLGGVISGFQDFLQMGYGVNMFSGTGYYFVGLRLPVGSFSVR